MNIYKIRIETIFDTAPSTVLINYDTKKKCIMYCDVYSNLSRVKGSHYEWIDEVSYGQCRLDIESLEMYTEIANSIANKNWKYTCGQGSSWYARNPLKDENLKQVVLKSLYSLGDDLRDFVVDNLKRGGFEDLMDSEGWMDALKFKFRLDDMNDVYIPIPLLMDLPSVDNRFLVKGEYDFDAHKDTRKIKFSER